MLHLLLINTIMSKFTHNSISMQYIRNEAKILSKRLLEPVRVMTIVAGPRQVGKTTLVRQILKARPSFYVAVDQPPEEPSPFLDSTAAYFTDTGTTRRDAEWLAKQWRHARAEAMNSEQGFIFVLDEIQKIPRWSEVVKGLWDADRANQLEMHVVLLGSSPLLMQKGLTESLAGRYELLRVSHWSFPEIHNAFDLSLEEYLYFGGYPGSIPFIRDEPRWREYVRASLIEPNIERDILLMTRVDKPALLKRLFQLGCEYSGQILSYTKMQGQLQDAGNTVTLAHYLDLLSQAGLITGIQKYAGQQHRRRSSSPKLNVLNTALISANSGYTFAEAKADRTFWGRLVESTVGAHLYNTGHGQPDCQLYYWREGAHEVDFIITRGHHLTAIEVKSGPTSDHAMGLDIFADKFKHARKLLVGENGLSLAEFLSYPARHWLE